jgi:DNA-binding SARP family transcriptional activator
MEFQLLGPIEVRRHGQRLPLGGPRQQALLAYLLLHREPVSAERLVRELWHEGEAPANGIGTVHTAVSRLRHTLGGRIERTSAGYTLVLEPDELDLDRFRALLAEAGAGEDAGIRSDLLRQADALWRGSPLDGLDVPFAASEARALEELRLAVIEDRVEVDLERGEHAALLPELVTLVAAQPLRERLRAQLILALYRSGRQAEALEAYRDCRRMLDDELGLAPSEELKELESAILRHDPSLDCRAAPRARAPEETSESRSRSRHVGRAILPALVAAGVAAAVAFAAVYELRSPSATTELAPTVPAPVVPAPRRPVATRPHARRRTKQTVSSHVVVTTTTEVIVTPPPTTTAPEATTTSTTPSKATTTPRVPPKQTPRPTPRPTTTPKPVSPPRAMTIADTFGGSAIDPTTWDQIRDGTGWDMTEEGGHLEFRFPPSSVPGGVFGDFGGHVGTLCSFTGDFDARVDYQLVEWPVGNEVTVTLFSFLGPQNASFQSTRTSHSSAGGGEQYSSYTGWWSSYLGDDRSGTLRVARRNGVVTTYYRHGGSWETMSAARDTGRASFGVGAMAKSTAGFGGQTITVDFSNFTVTGTNPTC